MRNKELDISPDLADGFRFLDRIIRCSKFVGTHFSAKQANYALDNAVMDAIKRCADPDGHVQNMRALNQDDIFGAPKMSPKEFKIYMGRKLVVCAFRSAAMDSFNHKLGMIIHKFDSGPAEDFSAAFENFKTAKLLRDFAIATQDAVTGDFARRLIKNDAQRTPRQITKTIDQTLADKGSPPLAL